MSRNLLSADAPRPAIVPPQPLLLPTPPNFNLDATVRSSDLYRLAPLVYDPAQPALQVVLYFGPGPGPEPTLAPGGDAGADAGSRCAAVEVLLWQPLAGQPLLVYGLHPGAQAEAALLQLRAMLRLDEDFALFYQLTDRDRDLQWVRRQDAARLLRSPTPYEDLVKSLLLGIAAPPRVQRIVAALCSALGERTSLGRRGFPSATQMAAQPLSFYEDQIGAGRCARPLRDLARLCESGALYPESLRRLPQAPCLLDAADEQGAGEEALLQELAWTERLLSLLHWLPGFGQRAAEFMLLLLGSYDVLRLDARTRAAWLSRFPPRRGAVRAHPDAQVRRIAARVAGFGVYRGLAQALLLRPPPAAV